MTCFDHNILLNAGALLARPHQVLGFGFRARGSLAAGSSLANTAALFPEPQRVSKKMRLPTADAPPTPRGTLAQARVSTISRRHLTVEPPQ